MRLILNDSNFNNIVKINMFNLLFNYLYFRVTIVKLKQTYIYSNIIETKSLLKSFIHVSKSFYSRLCALILTKESYKK